MDPVAFSIGGFDIRWYGILIATGIVLGILISQYNCKWREVDYDNLLNIVLISIPIGIIGARLYYVILFITIGLIAGVLMITISLKMIFSK